MREKCQIQMAHDVMSAVVLKEVPFHFPDELSKAGFIAALDALCWILEHEHNPTFEQNLNALVDELAAKGYLLTPHPAAADGVH